MPHFINSTNQFQKSRRKITSFAGSFSLHPIPCVKMNLYSNKFKGDRNLKSTIFVKPGKVEIQNIEKPTIQKADDVIIHILRACVCGSDLWAYRDLESKEPNSENSGHEAIGIVEEVGKAITTVKPGDFVIAPFTHGCGHCAACRAGYEAAAKAIAITLVLVTKLNTRAINTPSGRWLKFPASLKIIVMACSIPYWP